MLLAADVDPTGMIDFFEKLRATEGNLPSATRYLTSHPLAADRVDNLKKLVASIPHLIAAHSSAAARPSGRCRALDSITRTSRAPSPSRRFRAVLVASTDAWMRISGSGAAWASKPSAYPSPVE